MISLRDTANKRRVRGKPMQSMLKMDVIDIPFNTLIDRIVKTVTRKAELGHYGTDVYVKVIDGEFYSPKQEVQLCSKIEKELAEYFCDTFKVDIVYHDGYYDDEMYILLKW